MLHYLICPILWQLVIQFLDGEDSILLSQRLCLQSPSIKKLQRLALACRIYHECKNDCVCIKSNVVASPHTVQSRGADLHVQWLVFSDLAGFPVVCNEVYMRKKYPIYGDCKSFGGLALKPINCVLVPLCRFAF